MRAARRKGKQLWLELAADAEGPVICCFLMHFGMTGACVISGVAAPQYKSFAIDTFDWPPRFTKLELTLVDALGTTRCKLAYTDPRRFGRFVSTLIREFRSRCGGRKGSRLEGKVAPVGSGVPHGCVSLFLRVSVWPLSTP